MKKILLLASILFIATQALWAGPIDENRAREIAVAFFSGRATRSAVCDVELEWAGRDIAAPQASTFSLPTANTEKALLYIYNRSDKQGFVIVAGEECDTPIIAYSDKNGFDYENMAPSTRAILSAWSRQIEATKCGDMVKKDAAELAAESYGTVLKNYDSALWNQMAPYNNECPKYDGQRSVTGCVATAMAIVCYYNRWPEKGSGTTPSYSYTDYYYSYRTVSANQLGRTYNYDYMLHNYDYGYTTEQGNAVAALMYDMGTSVEMQYHYVASSAYSEDIVYALSNYFGYSKEARLLYRDRFSQTQWNQMLRDNIDTYGPTIYTGVGYEGGHAFIVDGYTDKNYFHFNFGWSGYNNGYWKTPDIEFYEYQDAVFYLAPDKDGSTKYRDYLSLTDYESGDQYYAGITTNPEKLERNKSFYLTLGWIWNEGNTTFNGTVAIAVCDKDGNVREILGEQNIQYLYTGYIMTLNYNNISFKVSPNPGDVLCALYTSSTIDGWDRLEGTSEVVVDEILLNGPAINDDIASNVSIRYDKNYNNNGAKAIIISSKVAINFEWKSKSGSVLKSGNCNEGSTQIIELESNTSGEYILTFSNDSDSYSINIKL